jgi:protein tyrosine/serine phosphatase
MRFPMTQNRRSNFNYAIITVGLCLLSLVSVMAWARRPANSETSIDNFGKVNDHYYRGSQPNQEQFAELKRLGIKTVIDLREDNKQAESQWVQDLGMQYFHIPLKTRVPASEQQTTYFLGLVNDPANLPVYVHCKGGRHRTGAMTGVYRITHDGWTADQAFREMKNYDFENGWLGGPGAQKNYVYSFYERYRASSVNSQK